MNQKKLQDALVQFREGLTRHGLPIGLNKTWDEIIRPYEQSFIAGVTWLLTQPLSERLSEEEREKIINLYKSEVNSMELENRRIKDSQSQIDQLCRESNFWQAKLKAELLERIFSTDMFNQNKTEK